MLPFPALRERLGREVPCSLEPEEDADSDGVDFGGRERLVAMGVHSTQPPDPGDALRAYCTVMNSCVGSWGESMMDTTVFPSSFETRTRHKVLSLRNRSGSISRKPASVRLLR